MKKDQSSKYYFDHPEVWEELNKGRFEHEPLFLMEVFRRYGDVRRVLDVGTGTGTHLVKLHEHGIEGVGIDLNEKMIAFARAEHPFLKFDVRDMRELPYQAEFDAVLCLCTTFSYNTTNEEVVATLQGFHRALRSGGLVVIDLLNAMGFIQKRAFKDRLEDTYETFGLRSATTHVVDEAAQQLIERRTVSTLDGADVRSDTTAYRLFFPQETRYFLETTGFEFVGFFGSYDIANTTLDGARMIVVARKA